MQLSNKGMRKGISLVEMMIAVILFAVLATIGLKYSKLFLDTGLSAKKARIAAAMDQATQLTAAYKLYTTQYGDPSSINDLNDSTKGILTSLPPAIPEIYRNIWDLNLSTGIGSGHGLTVAIDGNTSAKEAAQYCAIWNKEFNTSVELNVSGTENFGATLAAPTQVDATTATGWCWGDSTTGYNLFVKLP